MIADKEKLEELITHCLGIMNTRNEKFHKDFDIPSPMQFADFTDGQFVVLSKNGEVLFFDVVTVGSYNPDTDSFVWGWGNASMDLDERAKSLALRDLEEKTGFPIFSQRRIDDIPPEIPMELAAFSLEHLDGIAVFGQDMERSSAQFYHVITGLDKKVSLDDLKG